jgi:hypothetical protein
MLLVIATSSVHMHAVDVDVKQLYLYRTNCGVKNVYELKLGSYHCEVVQLVIISTGCDCVCPVEHLHTKTNCWDDECAVSCAFCFVPFVCMSVCGVVILYFVCM